MFKDRRDAASKLATKLKQYRGQEAIILALPRGGVVLGRVVADTLSLPLDIIVTRKIGHPLDSEYAIGAVSTSGDVVLNKAEITSIDKTWLQKEIEKQKTEAERRTTLYRQNRKSPSLSGKIVIIVDDGIATGFTMRLAVKTVKKQHPDKIIVAIPVSAPEPILWLKEEGADETITLVPPEQFLNAVGAHYKEFEQIEDKEVIALLGLQAVR